MKTARSSELTVGIKELYGNMNFHDIANLLPTRGNMVSVRPQGTADDEAKE